MTDLWNGKQTEEQGRCNVLNDRELARKLDPSGKIITPWTIRKWRLDGGMPSFSVGKRIFFKYDSVMAWIGEKEKGMTGKPKQIGRIRPIE